jgi:Ca-activated chloride channel family protein
MANITGSQSHYIDSSIAINEFFEIFLNEVTTEISHDMTIDYVHDRKVRIDSIYMVHPKITKLPIETPVRLGNLYLNKLSSYLISFQITEPVSIGDQLVLLDGILRMKMMEADTVQVNERVKISAVSRRVLEREKPPVEVMKALSLVTLFQLQEKARAHVQYGEYSAAVKQLGQIATRFFAQGHDAMAEMILEEAEKIKRSNTYSQDGEKRIKYGTRSLLQLPDVNTRKE